MEQGRDPRLLQRITCSDTKDGSELCITADDKREDFKVHLDLAASPAAIPLCFSEENQECIIVSYVRPEKTSRIVHRYFKILYYQMTEVQKHAEEHNRPESAMECSE